MGEPPLAPMHPKSDLCINSRDGRRADQVWPEPYTNKRERREPASEGCVPSPPTQPIAASSHPRSRSRAGGNLPPDHPRGYINPLTCSARNPESLQLELIRRTGGGGVSGLSLSNAPERGVSGLSLSAAPECGIPCLSLSAAQGCGI